MVDNTTKRYIDPFVDAALSTQALIPLMVQGTSMEPAIRRGARVWAVPLGNQFLAKGDVVTYLNPEGELVTHRIIECIPTKQTLLYRVKGDCLSYSETVRPMEIVYKIVRVSNFSFEYDTAGPFGRWAAKQAFSPSGYWKMLQRLILRLLLSRQKLQNAALGSHAEEFL
jgi:signal peptidase I